MPTSVRTKTPKKQDVKQAVSPENGTENNGLHAEDRDFEHSLSALENACQQVLQEPQAQGREDTERLYWQQRFINIATPVSLALMEYKGPRHFHYHYRHREDDEAVLHPVLENPIDMLAQVCKDALTQSHNELVGIDDSHMVQLRSAFEAALLEFLRRYGDYDRKVGK